MQLIKLANQQVKKLILLFSIVLFSLCSFQTISWAKTELIPLSLNGIYTQLGRHGISHELIIEPGEGIIVSCPSQTPQVKAFNLTDNAQRPAGTVYYLDCPDLIRGISFRNVQFLPPETTPDLALEEAILKEAGYPSSGANPDRYYYNKIDLNGDDKPEILAYLSFCGSGGCTLQIWQPAANGYQLLGNFPVTQQPVVVTRQTTNGWQDIIRATGGGGLPRSYYSMRYQDGHYSDRGELPSNSTVAGIGFFDEPFRITDGIQIEPR